MATYQAIAAVSEALRGLIDDRYPRESTDPLAPQSGFPTGLDVSLYQPRNFESPMTEGFAILLLRVTLNTTVRNPGDRRTADGRRLRPSLPVDLHYLIVPFAEAASTQQRMLGWVMRLLEDLGTLSASQLNHYVREIDTFSGGEALEVVSESPELTDYLSIWERLHALPPSAFCRLRMVLLDSQVPLGDGPAVQTRAFDMGKVAA
jgi:hypothetical protein